MNLYPYLKPLIRRKAGLAVCLGVVLLAAEAQAETLYATNRGVLKDTDTITSADGSATDNYLVGWLLTSERRNFFNFDLSAVTDTVTAATLKIYIADTLAESPDATEDLAIFDYTSSLAGLLAQSLNGDAFIDLGTGTQYGSASVSTGATTGFVQINLNAAAIADINAAAGGDFTVGGALTSMTATQGVYEYLFGFSIDSPATELDLVLAPEPSSLALLGLGALALTRRRR